MCDTCGCKGAETFEAEEKHWKYDAISRQIEKGDRDDEMNHRVVARDVNRNDGRLIIFLHNQALQRFREGFDAETFEAESERTFTVSKGPKRMYIVVEYNDGKELFLDGDGQKQFMEELAEAEATRDEILIEKLFGVGSDYHGIAQEVVEAEGFSAENLSFKERVEKMIDVASPKFKGIKGFGKRIGAKQGKKLDYKIQGILPKAKGVSSYRRNIETPKWYKGIQLGLMTGLAGFITYKLATDNSKEE